MRKYILWIFLLIFTTTSVVSIAWISGVGINFLGDSPKTIVENQDEEQLEQDNTPSSIMTVETVPADNSTNPLSDDSPTNILPYGGIKNEETLEMVEESSLQIEGQESKVILEEDINHYLIIALIILTIVTFLSLVTVRYLFKWRKYSPDKTITMSSTEFLEELERQKKQLHSFFSIIQEDKVNNHKKTNELLSSINQLTETVSIMRSALDTKDEEIKRSQLGHDSFVLKQYLIKLLKFQKYISDEIKQAEKNNNDKTTQRLKVLAGDFVELLEDFDLQEFSPEIGKPILGEPGLDNQYIKCPTTDKQLINTIKSVVSKGWLLKTPNGSEYIRPASVEVYIEEKGIDNNG